MAKKPDGSDHSVFDTLVESAAQVLAPNSLQFNENEFQRCALLSVYAALGVCASRLQHVAITHC